MEYDPNYSWEGPDQPDWDEVPKLGDFESDLYKWRDKAIFQAVDAAIENGIFDLCRPAPGRLTLEFYSPIEANGDAIKKSVDFLDFLRAQVFEGEMIAEIRKILNEVEGGLQSEAKDTGSHGHSQE